MSKYIHKAFFFIVLLFLSAPLIVVLGVSLNVQKRLLFPPQGFSLKWYQQIFVQSDWLNALLNSLTVATFSSMLALFIALPLAIYLWSKKNTLITKTLFGLGVAPFMLPPVISALGFMIFWSNAGFYGHILTTIISHAIFLVTLPLVTISLGLNSMNPQLIEAAKVMGANRKTILTTVILPTVKPYIISGFAFAFVLSLNEYIIAYMVSGFTVETLPIKIFNSLRYGYTPIMASIAVFFVFLAISVFGIVAYFGDLPKLLGAENSND